uniref:GPR158/179 extracellular domain-containing protein n=1 Tax=Anas platyrhynchos TaxID=8839 RepID=A0A8B9SKN3_ANAPL
MHGSYTALTQLLHSSAHSQPPASPSPGVPTSEPGPSGDAEGSVAALAFLRSGDAQRLARANCSRDIVAGAPGSGPPPALRAALRAAPEALAQAANFLNMLFQSNDIREASVAEDVEWYQALVRSLAEGHPWVRRAVLALDAHPLAAKPRLMLQATAGEGEIRLRDVSAAAPSLGNRSWDNEWFNALRAQRSPQLRKRVLSNDLRSMETPKWQRGDSYCQDGKFLPAWAVTLSSAFYGLKPDLSPEFKGVVRVDIELRDVGIDQCASGPGWFAGTHRCDLNSTQVPSTQHPAGPSTQHPTGPSTRPSTWGTVALRSLIHRGWGCSSPNHPCPHPHPHPRPRPCARPSLRDELYPLPAAPSAPLSCSRTLPGVYCANLPAEPAG